MSYISRFSIPLRFAGCVVLPMLLSACNSLPTNIPFIKPTPPSTTTPPSAPSETPPSSGVPVTSTPTTPPPVATPTTPIPSTPTTVAPASPPALSAGASFAKVKWDVLPDWRKVELQQTLSAFLQSCRSLKHKSQWQSACSRAQGLSQVDNKTLRSFFEETFIPYQVLNNDGTTQGLITGYYEPKLAGSRTRTARFRYPIYATPDDLLTIDLGDAYPQLKDLRLRGRVVGKKVVPYYSRGEIDDGKPSLNGRELFWVDNAVDLFFLQIQGSGRIELPDGTLVKIGYADQNGYPYVSLGKKLIEMGELKMEEASMQGIKRWAEQNPDRLSAVLAKNPSYVFFRELPSELSAPLGALGIPLTEAHSIAIDPRSIPLGAPVFLSTTYPNTKEPLNRLMVAQDTGGAIKGAVRADFFWGFGEQAGLQAGKMKQSGQMWVLLPKGTEPRMF